MTVVLLFAAALAAAPDGAAPDPQPQPAPNTPPVAAPSTAPAPVPAPADKAAAVTSYPPSFFAANQPSTALDMVGLLPGFSLDTGAGVRGFEGAAGNVLIDGERPASKTDTLDEVLKRIPARSVARIDIIRGAAPGIDMQGKTVIANVIRLDDQGLKLTTAAAGVYSTTTGRAVPSLRIEGSKRTGETNFELSLLAGTGADDGTGNGPRTVRNGAGVITQTAEEHSYGQAETDKLQAAVETPVAGGKLRIEGSAQHNPYTYRDDDFLLDPVGREFERYTQGQDTAEIGVRYTRPLGEKASLETYVLQQLGHLTYVDDFHTADFGVPEDVSHFTLNKVTGETIARGVWKYSATPTLSLEAGAEGAYNWLKNRTFLSDDGTPITLPAANVFVDEKRGEGFFTATWQARPTLNVELGLRIEGSIISSTGDLVASNHFVFEKPRAVITWTPDAADQVRFRIEREVDQLDFADFTASGSLGTGTHAGNPQLTPQQDWVIEAAYDRRFWGGGDAGITLRRYWLTDVIDRAPTCDPSALLPGNPPTCDPAQEFDAPANVGNGYKDELYFTLTLPTDKLWLPNGLLTVHSTWRLSGVTDPSTHRQREISGLHPVDADIHFTQTLTRMKATWGFDIFPSWRQTFYRFDEVDTDHLGTWVDFFYEYKPKPDFTLRAEIDNASSRGFVHIRDFYDPFRDAPGGGELSSVDNRHPHFGMEFYLRARKTFG